MLVNLLNDVAVPAVLLFRLSVGSAQGPAFAEAFSRMCVFIENLLDMAVDEGGIQSPQNPTDSTHAYPTDSRERQKAKEKADKEKGIVRVVKKKKKHVEEHYDDCGESLDSLTKDLDNYPIHDDDLFIDAYFDDDSGQEEADDPVVDALFNIEQSMFYGKPTRNK